MEFIFCGHGSFLFFFQKNDDIPISKRENIDRYVVDYSVFAPSTTRRLLRATNAIFRWRDMLRGIILPFYLYFLENNTLYAPLKRKLRTLFRRSSVIQILNKNLKLVRTFDGVRRKSLKEKKFYLIYPAFSCEPKLVIFLGGGSGCGEIFFSFFTSLATRLSWEKFSHAVSYFFLVLGSNPSGSHLRAPLTYSQLRREFIKIPY